jgi:hypothetical protein
MEEKSWLLKNAEIDHSINLNFYTYEKNFMDEKSWLLKNAEIDHPINLNFYTYF